MEQLRTMIIVFLCFVIHVISHHAIFAKASNETSQPPSLLTEQFINERRGVDSYILESDTGNNNNNILANMYMNSIRFRIEDTLTEDYELSLNTTNTSCYNFVSGDIATSEWNNEYEYVYSSNVFEIYINRFSIQCSGQYTYSIANNDLLDMEVPFADMNSSDGSDTNASSFGSGTFLVDFSNSSATFSFYIPSYNAYNLLSLDGSTCSANMIASAITFQTARTVEENNLLSSRILSLVESESTFLICDKLLAFGPRLLDTPLNHANERISKVLENEYTQIDALSVERNFPTLEQIDLVKFMSTSTSNYQYNEYYSDDYYNSHGSDWYSFSSSFYDSNIANSSVGLGIIITAAIQQSGSLLGRLISNDEDNTDLVINYLLQTSNILTDDGVYAFNESTTYSLFENATYVIDDGITQTTLTIVGLRIVGLDEMTTFSPIQPVGVFTVENTIEWDHLIVDFDLRITIATSSESDNFPTTDPDPIDIVENVTATFNVSNIQLVTNVFAAIDLVQLQSFLSIGSLFFLKNSLLQCFLDTNVDLQITKLVAVASSFTGPMISGFATPGLDVFVEAMAQAFVAVWEPTFIRVTPQILQHNVRDVFNQRLLDRLVATNDSSSAFATCPDDHISNLISTLPKYVDFRELLLNSSESKRLGGLGKSPYGSTFKLVYDFVLDSLTQKDPTTAELTINDAVIKPITQLQSGTEGLLVFDCEVINSASTWCTTSNWKSPNFDVSTSPSLHLWTNITMNLMNVRISNVATITNPLALIKPTTNAYVVENVINFRGKNGESIKATLSLVVDLFGRTNTVEVGIFVESLNIILHVLAKIKTELFVQFSLDDATSLDCWFALLTPVTEFEGYDDLAINATFPNHNLSLISDFEAIFTSLHVDAYCVSCASYGMNLLPSLFGTVDRTEAVSVLGDRIQPLLTLLLISPLVQTKLEQRIKDAPTFCASSSDYDPDAAREQNHQQHTINHFLADKATIETILYATILVAEIGFVVISESVLQELYSNTGGMVVDYVIHESTSYSDDYWPLPSPISVSMNFSQPDGLRLIDWTNLTGSIPYGDIIGYILDETRISFETYEGTTMTSMSGTLDGLISEYVSKFLHADHGVTLDLNLAFKYDDFSLAVTAFRMKGFDKLYLPNVFEPIEPQVLMILAQLDTLELELDIVANITNTSETISQLVTMNISIEDPVFRIFVLGSFEIDKIENLQLGSLLDAEAALECFLSTSYIVDVSEVQLQVSNYSIPTFTGFASDTTGKAISEATNAIFHDFMTTIKAGISQIVGDIVQDSLSRYVTLLSTKANCTTPIRTVDQRKLDDYYSTMYNYTDSVIDNLFMAKSGNKRMTEEDALLDFRNLVLTPNKSVDLGGSGTYGNVAPIIYQLITEAFVAENETQNQSPPYFVNKIISQIFDEEWSVPGTILQVYENITIPGANLSMKISVHDFYLKNVDTITGPLPLLLLQPVKNERSILNSTIVFEDPLRPFTIGFRFLFSLTMRNTDDVFYSDIDVRIRAEKVKLLVSSLIEISEMAFMKFPIRDIANLQCWLATIQAPALDKFGVRVAGSEETLRLKEFNVTVNKPTVDLTCIECSERKVVDDLAKFLSDEENSQHVTNNINTILKILNRLMEGKFLEVKFDRALNDAPMQCPHHKLFNQTVPTEERQATKYTIALLSNNNKSSDAMSPLEIGIITLCALLLLFGSVIYIGTKQFVQRRYIKWLDTLDRHKLNALVKIQDENEQIKLMTNGSTKELFASRIIPLWVRVSMPIALVANFIVFCFGQFGVCCSANYIILIADNSIQSQPAILFSLADVTFTTWNAGRHVLALTIFGTSFLWPLMRQVATFLIWFAPTKTLSVQTRGMVCQVLAAMSKWSAMDIFLLSIGIAVLQVSIKSPTDLPWLPVNFYQIDFFLSPEWGLYAKVVFQIISQILSQYTLYCHRVIVDDALNRHFQTSDQPDFFSNNDDQPSSSATREWIRSVLGTLVDIRSKADRLRYHAFRRVHRTQCDNVVVRPIVTVFMVGTVAVTCIFSIFGFFLSSFTVAYAGIIGIVINGGLSNTETKATYSVFGLSLFLAVSFLSILLPPLLLGLMFIVQWMVKINHAQQAKLLVAIETVHAWQYSEVYLLSVLVAVFQIGSLSQSVINPSCDSVELFLRKLAYYDVLKDVDAQCLKIDMNLEPIFFLYSVAILALSIIKLFVTMAASQCLDDTIVSAKLSSDDVDASAESFNAPSTSDIDSCSVMRAKLSLVPAQITFVDRFRWLLQREDMSHATLPSQTTVTLPHSQSGPQFTW